ncbi:flagellar assembly protein FliH [Gracilibacillus caseinilyticus]|uniref:Flagellar assembly protein FliH n=1 Tax=Gracilibacillus caseinilyticus TaxID=2932256 RepID=A0ABY4EUI2_9BACI|nr:flagellar assembly protein FliH [Gracilibacillus caseinilyticus]UOQ47878.1 flagellar assembly protein FliH [Gracilibacillus caseinilyticus]
MSNHHSLPPRQIQLRKVETPSSRSEYEGFSTEKEDISKQIANAKQQLNNTLQQTEQLKFEAQQEIDKLRTNWEAERQQYIEQAQQEGYQQGFQQGKQDSTTQFQSLITEAQDVLQTANKEYHKIVAESDETILNLSLAVAEKIIQQSLDEDHSKFVGLAKSLMNQVKEHPSVTLFVSAQYYPVIQEYKEELSAILIKDIEFMIYPSSILDGEQIMIETPFGKIDASVDTQLEEIRNQLSYVVEEITREYTNDIG